MRFRVMVVPPTGRMHYSFLDSVNPEPELEKIIGSTTVSTIDVKAAKVGVAFDETAGDRDNPEPNPRAMKLYDTLLETSWADGETLLGTWVFYGLTPSGRPVDVPREVVRFVAGYAETSIGCLPIIAPRGGIKYPKPKGTTMPERLTKAQVDHELRLNDELLKELRRRRVELQRQAKVALPAEPPNYTMFTVSVRFKMRGQRYQFLILKSAGHYWTTGTKKEQQVFSSWEALCEWLEGPEVYDHSDLEILQSSGKAVSFTSGAIERMDPIGEPPF